MLELRSIHGVEVAVEHGLPTELGAAALLRFPTGQAVQIRDRGYENREEALAAEVAVWRIRRIRRGTDRPEVVGTTGRPTF